MAPWRSSRLRGIAASQSQIKALQGCSHLLLTQKGHSMAHLRSEGTCLSGPSDVLMSWWPERIYGGDVRAALPLATQWIESYCPVILSLHPNSPLCRLRTLIQGCPVTDISVFYNVFVSDRATELWALYWSLQKSLSISVFPKHRELPSVIPNILFKAKTALARSARVLM